MTHRTNARLAGVAFLLYIVVGISSLIVFNKATGGAGGAAAKLAAIAAHEGLVRLNVVLNLVIFLCAVTLAVTLWALTKETDPDVAMFGLCCRLSEGAVGVASAVRTLGLVSVAQTSVAGGADAATATALGGLLLGQGGLTGNVDAALFAFGSTAFSYLFLRARSIPVWLAWLGVFASVLLVVLLPAQLGGVKIGLLGSLMWIPMLVFEVVLAVWLIVKGTRTSITLG